MTALYLDACSIVPLFLEEPSSAELTTLIETADEVVVSDFGAGEVASTLSRKVRERAVTAREARQVLAAFDPWLAGVAQLIETAPADIRRAAELVRHFELKLRMPDALHIATCQARHARLLTRDRLMAEAADALGLDLLRLD